MEERARLTHEFLKVHSRRVQQAVELARRKGEPHALIGWADASSPLSPDMRIEMLTREEVIGKQSHSSPGLRWCVAQMETCEETECVAGLVFGAEDMLTFKVAAKPC